ncbi:MAG: hypothetical protein J6B29_01690 [Clostridia bacterium]|nr:hypothetical protein [Clostridia bacterium]
MNWKNLFKAVFYPHIAIMLILIPVSAVLLVGSLVFVGSDEVFSYVSYAVSAYTLTVWCMGLPRLIRGYKSFKKNNKYARAWFENTHLRVKATLYGSFAWNVIYSLFHLWLGLYHQTIWFYSLGAYYMLLAIMRFSLMNHARRYNRRERIVAEIKKYRTCGWILLIMSLALAIIIFFMVYWNRTFNHNPITTIAIASFTFTALAIAIVGVVKYRKYQSPIYSASKAISLASACVSMLTLESTMLNTFGDGAMTAEMTKLMLGISGVAISSFIVIMAIYMIVHGTRKIKETNAFIG